MSEGRYFFYLWLIGLVILFAVCSFIQFTIKIDEWSTVCRGIFGVGALFLAGLCYYWYTNASENN